MREHIEYHESMVKKVCKAIKEFPRDHKVDIDQISKNIDYLKEEIKVGKTDDLHGLFYQLNAQYTMADRFLRPSRLPDADNPYFAYMKIEEGGREREVFLGHISFLPAEHDFRIVDWAKAPIAKLYFNYLEGEEFDLELPHKTLTGTVLEKMILTVRKGELVRIDRGQISYVKVNGEWSALDEELTTLEGGEGAACREINLGSGRTNLSTPDVISLLDQDQFQILHQDDSRALLITGGAGSGKTTAALHRIAVLCHSKNYSTNDILVVVPEKGIEALSRKLLEHIKLEKVRVTTAQRWLVDRGRNLFYGLPRKMTPETPVSVSLMKRHGTMIELIKRYVEKQRLDLIEKFSSQEKMERVVWKLNNDRKPLLLLLLELEKKNKDELIKMALQKERKRLSDFNRDRLQLLTDRELMNEAVAISGGVITSRMVDETVAHTIYQIRDKNNDFIDDTTLDGKEVDAGTSFELSGTIDEEDFPILFRLLLLKNGSMITKKGRLKRYRHIVLDEAQEYAPLELLSFREMLHPEGTFTVAGDSAQQIDETVSFSGWDGVIDTLGIDDLDMKELAVSYRSPFSIVDFAHKILGKLAPAKAPVASRQGKQVAFTETPHRAHTAMVLNDALVDLTLRERQASIAIICSRTDVAQSIYNGLQGVGRIRLVTSGDFCFKPGVDVTTVDQVKGLEFDYVIIPDVDSYHYPDRDNERRRLHLAATRAIHQLWIIYSEARSKILDEVMA